MDKTAQKAEIVQRNAKNDEDNHEDLDINNVWAHSMLNCFCS